MKAGHGNPSSPFYTSQYLPVYNTIQSIQAQLTALESQLSSLKAQQDSIQSQMGQIIDAVSLENNFTEEEQNELNSFIREEELSCGNYIVTDSMTEEERLEMLQDLLKFGEKELAKASVPQLTFDVDMVNLFALSDFEPFHMDFDPGNYIWVTLRDDFSIKARLLSVHLNFLDNTDFSVTFGNIVKRNASKYHDITDVLRTAQSIAASVSFNSSHWSQAAKDTSAIHQILNDGLIAAGRYLKNGDDSEMVIDRRGIFVNTTTGAHAGRDAVYVGGGRILFTEDNWKTVSMSVGRADVTIRGVTESRFGTFADFVIAGYVGGSVLEGDEIIGGKIQSTDYSAVKTGSVINLNDGTFEFNAKGESRLSLNADGTLTVKGTVKADKGYIGGKNGFSIEDGRLYSGKPSLSSSSEGIYVGTDGIALGTDNVFSITAQGYVTAKSGSIGGAAITDQSIHSSNDKWQIHSDGSAYFTNVTIGDKSIFGSTIANPFSGTAILHIQTIAADYIEVNYLKAMKADIASLVARDAEISNLVATKASVEQLNAANAEISKLYANEATLGNLIATKASIESLQAVNAEIENIKTNYITAAKVNADYATIAKLNAIDAKFNNINADNITAGTLSADRLHVDGIIAGMKGKTIQCISFTAQTIRGSQYQIYRGETYHPVTVRAITVDGERYEVLAI